MFETYGFPILLFAAIGLLAALLLSIVSKLFAVKTDERIGLIDDELPHANCGACGFAGCTDYAEAIVQNHAATNLCKVGGTKLATQIANVMGTEALEVKPEIAVLHCHGECNQITKKFIYDGIQTCASAKRFYLGSSGCVHGCMGLGDCVDACDYSAIKIVDGIANIQPGLCRACGKCAKVCPNHLISLRPTSKHFDVRCSSTDKGRITKVVCRVGCIGCKICEKKCNHNAVHVENNHAVIDYQLCHSCGICCDACPTGAICNCENTD